MAYHNHHPRLLHLDLRLLRLYLLHRHRRDRQRRLLPRDRDNLRLLPGLLRLRKLDVNTMSSKVQS